MTTFAFSLRPAEAETFTDLARLHGVPEEELAADLVRSFVESTGDDKEIQAALKAMKKLRNDGTVATRAPARDSRHRRRRKRVVQGRSLSNLPNGLEVLFEGKLATVRNGQLELDGRRFSTPSPAAVHAAGGGSYNGWAVWKDQQGNTLADIHRDCLSSKRSEGSG